MSDFLLYSEPATGDKVAGRLVNTDQFLQSVDPRLDVVRLTATPTISTTVYAAKDAVGGLLTLAGAVRVAGGSGMLMAIQLVDASQQRNDLEVVFFRSSITAPVDNTVFDPTDAELANCVGAVVIGGGFYSDFSDNSVATINNIGMEFTLAGTDLFAVIVARATPTYTATTDLVLACTILRD